MLESAVIRATVQSRFTTILVTAFALIGLLLATVGTYRRRRAAQSERDARPASLLSNGPLDGEAYVI
jgi:preprotein translocase subunit SecG